MTHFNSKKLIQNKKHIVIYFMLIWTTIFSFSQNIKIVNDVKDEQTKTYVLKNATVYIDYRTKKEKVDILIINERIKDIGTKINIPENSVIIDLNGKYVYPSFIDMYSNYGIEKLSVNDSDLWENSVEQFNTNRLGAFNVNQAINSDFYASEAFNINEKEALEYKKIGFGLVASFKNDGIFRGTACLVNLNYNNSSSALLLPAVATHYSFLRGSSTQLFPVSLMGAVALVRQTKYDAQWYQKNKNFTDLSLNAYLSNNHLPKIFQASHWMDISRIASIADEFKEDYIIKTSGDEYQRVEELKKPNLKFILPLSFPEPYNISSIDNVDNYELNQLKHWELAPYNAVILANNGIEFAFTTYEIKDKSTFLSQLIKVIKNGLSEEIALKSITYNPAKFLKIDSIVGTLNNGKLANFIITTGNIFNPETEILENWTQGNREIITEATQKNLTGDYILNLNNINLNVTIKGKLSNPQLEIFKDSVKLNAHYEINPERIIIKLLLDSTFYILNGWNNNKNNFTGVATMENTNQNIPFNLTLIEKEKTDTTQKNITKKTDTLQEKIGKIIYPFTAFGNEQIPIAQSILIKNATLWTNEAEGIVSQMDILIEQGKIKRIAKNINNPNAIQIDATNKHVTPGIIDEHSHIALSSVNDLATNSSMCRMMDVVRSDDIDIFRNLAGGVVAAQLLHGSANPIGGQSAIVKMRWGYTPKQMLIANAAPFIKFALGENVKRSYNFLSIRYPQTRMGVEQVYLDLFTQAKEYDQAWKNYKTKKISIEPRVDLSLEALSEIVNKQRFITCHSYVQSEITMLMRVAEKFNFKVNTFTHILEGYKVADKMKTHGVGASTFSDWGAYKMEVVDAIPYNAGILNNMAIITAINSDDAEMSRRLNQEAAKSIKYSNLSEEEAFKMITINPAKLLHLDNRMGSLKVGKDADIVIWSANPLSVYARVENTIVDGIIFFDANKIELQVQEIRNEKIRIIKKMMDGRNVDTNYATPKKSNRASLHCDDVIINN